MKTFGRSPHFRLVDEGAGKYFFVHAGGNKVATDAFGAMLWEALPGTVDEIAARIADRADVSRRMLGDFLRLMECAEIAVGEPPGALPSSLPAGSPAVSASPPVSVVIVTLNGKAHIRECLASLRSQTVGPLDIHVVDNGSTDGTLDIIRDEFPEVRLHALTKNLFYPGGVNYGIAATAGAYILVLNDDVELTPGFTAEMVRVMEASPRAAAVVPMMKLYYLRGFINGIGNHVRTKGWGSDNYVGYVDIGQLDDVIEVPSACVSAALLRRAAIETAGAFDAAYRAYYEDADWSFRMRRAGWTINAAPKALVYHKFSAFWKNMERKLKLAARNRLRFVLKNFDGRLRRAFLRSYMKEDLINILSLIKHRRNAEAWAYVRAYGSLILTLPDILDKRAAAKRTWKGSGASAKVEAILKLNPPQWSGMNTDNVPRLDTGIYFAYYARQFAKIDRTT